ncbi:minor coat protein [Cupriavidus basilensis OR16]|uniref:Minor coat protein n=1 Tax=Cupriavidus basilensis OR16 TaxID=1127483 RepID=H1SF39_9BURK|nr:hypothetical protein [Cupriavidus basilensis]EHP38864.1 minor coat protein [Cupriavidus basilensis OR16]
MSFDPIINALNAFATWLLGLFGKAFAALWDLCSDLFINVADLFFQALAALIVAIPAPTFLSNYTLQSLFTGFSSDILYFVGVFRITEGIALLGVAFGFRMLRKVVTLFQW